MNDIVIIENKIYEIRGQKVMLDFDLAEMYEIETRVLNQSVRRNIERFPDDFMFQLTNAEANSLKDRLTSQIVVSNKGGNRYAPFAFTEQGVAMLSGILRSPRAIEVNINIMRLSSICANTSSPMPQSKSWKNCGKESNILKKTYHLTEKATKSNLTSYSLLLPS